MIRYQSGGYNYLLKIFLWHGSVFPYAGCIAAPCAFLSAITRELIDRNQIPFLAGENAVLKESQAWSGFTFLIGFLIVFRTSQSYSRFWDGLSAVHRMQAEWFDSAAALVAFCSTSKASEEDVQMFKHTIVRLLSMLHAAALGQLEDTRAGTDDMRAAFSYELLDVESLDLDSRKRIKFSDSRAELIFTWVQAVIVKNMDTGVLSIAPPILSRTFQTLSNGMVAFHDAVKISDTPFPFPYAQTCDFLLIMHWIISPFVYSQFTKSSFWAFVFCFTQVFIFWALNLTAVEIENPFGVDANDLDGHHMQKEMNKYLRLLVSEDVVELPQLRSSPAKMQSMLASSRSKSSFFDAWLMKPSSARSPPGEDTDRRGRVSVNSSCRGRVSHRSDGSCATWDVPEESYRRASIYKHGHSEVLDKLGEWSSFDRDITGDESVGEEGGPPPTMAPAILAARRAAECPSNGSQVSGETAANTVDAALEDHCLGGAGASPEAPGASLGLPAPSAKVSLKIVDPQKAVLGLAATSLEEELKDRGAADFHTVVPGLSSAGQADLDLGALGLPSDSNVPAEGACRRDDNGEDARSDQSAGSFARGGILSL